MSEPRVEYFNIKNNHTEESEPSGQGYVSVRLIVRAAGVMVFEKFIRYAGLAVELKPSARGCEGRRRGLERIVYSKTIRPRLRDAKPAGAGESGVCIQRPSRLG